MSGPFDHLMISESSGSDSFGNDREWIDVVVLIAIAVCEDKSSRYDVHFRAAGNEGVDPILCEQAFDDGCEFVDVASFFDLVDQFVMNQILVMFIGKNDMLLRGRPKLVILE